MATYIELAFDKQVHQTKSAILFDMGEPEPTWIPKAVIDMDEYDERDNVVPVKEGWAIDKGLV